MAAPALPAEVRQLREQLLRDQAPSARQRTEVYDPAVFVSRYGRPYSSLRLPLSTLKEMRTDAILRFAQLTALVSIFAAKWHIDCADARKAQFIDHALRRIIGRLIVQFFECVPAGQRVMMADGTLRAIEEIREGDFVLSSDGTSIVPDQVEAVWSTEEKQILRIKLSDGRVMRVSPDHKVYRWGDWVRAGDLVIGDAVTVPRQVSYLGVDDWDVETQKDDAFLLALWLAEGNKGYNQGFSVCNVDPTVVDRARLVAQRKGWDFHHDAKRGVMRMTGNSFYRRGPTPPNFLRAYGVVDMSTTTIGIPDQVMSAPTAVVSEFIGTYIACDGTVKRAGTSGSGCQTIFYSASERMVRDMQALLTRLGVRATVSSEPRQNGHLDCWKTTISAAEENKRLADAVYAYGKDGRLKQFASAALTNLQSLRDCAIPPAIYEDLTPVGRSNSGARITGKSWTDSRRALEAARASDNEALQEKLTSGLGWARVVEVAEDGREPCFDLQTRDHHAFFLESGLVHNSWNFGWQSLVKEFGLLDPGWEFLDKNAEGGPKVAKVWDGSPQPALVWEPFVPLPPESVAPVWTQAGAFNGIAVNNAAIGGGYGLPMTSVLSDDVVDVPPEWMGRFTSDDQRQKVDLQNSLWVTNERDGQWGRIWGFPRLAYAFKYWWSGELALGILNRSVEKKGDPTIVVAFPSGNSPVNGRDVPNRDIAFEIGAMARSGSVLAVPSEVWGDDMATANQAPKWKVETLKLEADFDSLVKVMGYFDTMKFRATLVSELALAEGSGGTSSRNVASVTGERTAEAQIFTQTEWDEVINRYMIPQLADANFPELKDVPARKVTQAFGEDEANLAADLIRSMANANPALLPVDWKAALERFQVDSLEGDQLATFEKRLIKQAEASTPPKVEAQPNGAAGVTDTGFYYDARERIELEDDALLAALPRTKVYADRAVLAQTRLVRKLWFSTLTDAYESFAKHVESTGLALAGDDAQTKADKVAERVLKSWRFSYAKTIKSVVVALGRILARAGSLELSASRVKTDAWNPEDKTVVAWARENAATLVRSVDETTRDQLRAFLAAEIEAGHDAASISKGLRAHFAQFPSWRADLIAREETKRYYNAGTLFAAEAVEAQVQALDALHGPTDHECEKRNGRLFDVNTAWQESAKEHVRGTLCWRIVPGTQLSLRSVKSTELDGELARVDQVKREILLADEVDPAAAGDYLVRAVDWLVSQQ
jgi:intein/homing endonuclease